MSNIEVVRRRAARAAGLAYLISFTVLVAVNFGILEPLLAHSSAAEIARNILAQETLFRVGIAGLLLNAAGILVASIALYVLLEPVDMLLALIALLGRSVYAFTWILLSLSLLTALKLLTNAEYSGIPAGELQALARLFLSGHDGYYVGLLFWSLAATAGSYLWLRSRLIPRTWALFGIVASAWCAACTLALYLAPGFADVVNLWLFDTPMVLFELVLSVRLLVGRLEPLERHSASA
jgi:hypothetical protein